MCRKTSLGKEPDMAPLECMLAVLFAAGMAWLAACIYALAKRRELDTRLLAQAVHQIALGRHAYVRDLVRDDPRWTPRMIARAADGAAGKPAEILEALPETFLADLVRVRERMPADDRRRRDRRRRPSRPYATGRGTAAGRRRLQLRRPFRPRHSRAGPPDRHPGLLPPFEESGDAPRPARPAGDRDAHRPGAGRDAGRELIKG
jgi:hypothetical protein